MGQCYSPAVHPTAIDRCLTAACQLMGFSSCSARQAGTEVRGQQEVAPQLYQRIRSHIFPPEMETMSEMKMSAGGLVG